MRASLAPKLGVLRSEFESLTGRSFDHFFCPILVRDEPVELAEGHVINSAFPNSARRTVVQRADVEHFFGAHFEADFVLLAHKGQITPAEVLLDRDLSRKLRPRLLVDGQTVEHYVGSGENPPHHSKLLVERGSRHPVPLVLKLDPTETVAALDRRWEVEIAKDIRLPALVSLLKAAHLTMFAMMGYSYALTAGGLFAGWEILGRFVASNLKARREVVRRNAAQHFDEFVNLVRPMIVAPDEWKVLSRIRNSSFVQAAPGHGRLWFLSAQGHRCTLSLSPSWKTRKAGRGSLAS